MTPSCWDSSACMIQAQPRQLELQSRRCRPSPSSPSREHAGYYRRRERPCGEWPCMNGFRHPATQTGRCPSGPGDERPGTQ
jgi:hypothetical protein